MVSWSLGKLTVVFFCFFFKTVITTNGGNKRKQFIQATLGKQPLSGLLQLQFSRTPVVEERRRRCPETRKKRKNRNLSHLKPTLQQGPTSQATNNKDRQKTPSLRRQILSACGGYHRTNRFSLSRERLLKAHLSLLLSTGFCIFNEIFIF